jgi:hypothetical protein
VGGQGLERRRVADRSWQHSCARGKEEGQTMGQEHAAAAQSDEPLAAPPINPSSPTPRPLLAAQ